MSYIAKTWANKEGRIYTIISNRFEPVAVRAYHETAGMGNYYTHNLAHDLADFENSIDPDDLEWEVPYEFLAEVEARQQEEEWEMGECSSDNEIAALIADSIVNNPRNGSTMIARNGIIDQAAIVRTGLDTVSPQIESLMEE